MDNPNEYDDNRFLRADVEAIDSISEMWMAGSSLSNIEASVESGLENVLPPGAKVRVSIEVA